MIGPAAGRPTRFLLTSAAAAVLLTCASRSLAQAPPDSNTPNAISDAEWRRQMEGRMQQLEQENAALRKQVGDVADTQQAVM